MAAREGPRLRVYSMLRDCLNMLDRGKMMAYIDERGIISSSTIVGIPSISWMPGGVVSGNMGFY